MYELNQNQNKILLTIVIVNLYVTTYVGIYREPPYTSLCTLDSILVSMTDNGGQRAKYRQTGPRYKTLCLAPAREIQAINRSTTLDQQCN